MLSPIRERENTDPLVTTRWVAEVFRVDPKTVTRWCKSGRLTAIKHPGGHWRVRRSAVDVLLKVEEITTDG